MRIYTDKLLRVSLVVEHGGELWLVPQRPGGWTHRSRITMTAQARAERLKPARGIDAAGLGIPMEPARSEVVTSGIL